MRFRDILIGLLAVIAIAHPAQATIDPALHVPALVDGSDLIVVGRIAALTTQNVAEGTNHSGNPSFTDIADISVSRILKGRVPKDAHFVTLRLDVADGKAWVEKNEFGVFFLQRDDTVYRPTDAYYPVLVASPTLRPDSNMPVDPLTLVARELVGVLATKPAALTDPYSGVHKLPSTIDSEIVTPLSSAQVVYSDAEAAIRTIPNEITSPMLTEIATAFGDLRLLWIENILISQGRTEYISSIEDFLMTPPKELKFTATRLALAISSQAKAETPAAIPMLSRLLHSTNVDVRHAAAASLVNIGTAEVIAPLASVALKDDDRGVRAQAIMGLCQATGRQAAPCQVKYDEASQMAYWTQWAASNGLK